MNTSGIRRIAIMPFESSFNTANTPSRNPGPRNPVPRDTVSRSLQDLHLQELQRDIPPVMTVYVTNQIQALNYLTLVSDTMIRQLQAANTEKLENYVDALFTGRVTRIGLKESTEEREETRGNQRVKVTYHIREVDMEYNYSFTRVPDGSLIGPVNKYVKNTDTNINYNELTPPVDLLRAKIAEQLRNELYRDVAPYTAVEYRTLEREKSKDTILKTRMKDASANVKAGNHRSALNEYLEIFASYRNEAAAINASILYEALGETQAAADFLQGVVNATGNTKIRSILARLNRILDDQAVITAEFTARGQVNRVSAYAKDEIMKVLPQNAKVWVFVNPGNVSDSMANDIADNISSYLINDGISVVERDLRLIEAERNFQASGSVNDNDLVSISRAVGANTIVSAGVTGTGALRRLQLRVLDVEKATVLLQSTTGDSWRF
jgi:hypothetical protein